LKLFIRQGRHSTGHSIKKEKLPPGLVLVLFRSLLGIPDLLVGLVLSTVLMIYYHQTSAWIICLLLPAVLMNVLTALAVSLWINILSIKHKDWVQLLITLVGFAWWFTPVIYPPELVPGLFRHFLYLNPMALVIGLYRWAYLGIALTSGWYLLGLSMMMLLFVSGFVIFLKIEKSAVDVL
jgi:lipopolysaccharide transport system permease protein